jgi:hypothetical protein
MPIDFVVRCGYLPRRAVTTEITRKGASMLAVLDSPETRCAKSISGRVHDIAADVSEERQQEYCTNVESLVIDCASLAKQWRAAVSRFTTAINCSHDVDYRELGQVLNAAICGSVTLYEEVQGLATKSGCGVSYADMADLTLAMIEAKNIQNWLDTWPRYNKGRHEAARLAIAEGDFCTDDDIRSWTAS